MNCVVCGEIIDKEREEALLFLNKLPYENTCRNCMPDNKVKGIYNSGQLILVNNVGASGILKDNSVLTTYDN